MTVQDRDTYGDRMAHGYAEDARDLARVAAKGALMATQHLSNAYRAGVVAGRDLAALVDQVDRCNGWALSAMRWADSAESAAYAGDLDSARESYTGARDAAAFVVKHLPAGCGVAGFNPRGRWSLTA